MANNHGFDRRRFLIAGGALGVLAGSGSGLMARPLALRSLQRRPMMYGRGPFGPNVYVVPPNQIVPLNAAARESLRGLLLSTGPAIHHGSPDIMCPPPGNCHPTPVPTATPRPYQTVYGYSLYGPNYYAATSAMTWSYRFTYGSTPVAGSMSNFALTTQDSSQGQNQTVSAVRLSDSKIFGQVVVGASIPPGVTNFIRDYVLSHALDWLLQNAFQPANQGILAVPSWCPPNGGTYMPIWIGGPGNIPNGWQEIPPASGWPAPGGVYDPWSNKLLD